jgi:hypothetical protein
MHLLLHACLGTQAGLLLHLLLCCSLRLLLRHGSSGCLSLLGCRLLCCCLLCSSGLLCCDLLLALQFLLLQQLLGGLIVLQKHNRTRQ